MRRKLELSVLAASLLLMVLATAPAVSAQSFNFTVGQFTSTNVCANSGSPAPGCQVLTNGFPNNPITTGSGALRVTTAHLNQHGSAWFNTPQPISTGFTTAFQFQFSSTNSCYGCSFPADGLALVIQGDPAGTGALGYVGNGQNMAYGNNDVSTASGPGRAIQNSLAIELDTHINSDYGDPDGNHIAVQSCGPNNSSTLTPNSADHGYICPDSHPAKLGLQSLPAGSSLTDGSIHTITVNYLPPGNCTSNCNNLSVYFDSTLILQTTVDITKQLYLTGNGSAYIGFTAATGAVVENADIISWSFSSLPLAPITINQPLQTGPTNFNYTPKLSAITDYSQSGLPPTVFQGVVMQGTVQTITDQQYADLVTNTPFQGSTCQHQDSGQGSFGCVITTDLCTTPTNSVPSGANCPNTGTDALINVSNSYVIDPTQKPIVAPGYIMGKDTALNCGVEGDNTCKGLVNIFSGITGDPVTKGHTNNFNSILIPNLGVVQPGTSATTVPPLNSGWINQAVTVNLSSIETVPANNSNPPSPLPTITSIGYSASGANLPTPVSGTLPGASGSVAIPATSEGTTVLTYSATDSAGTPETVITNTGTTVSSSSPSLTIKFDLTPPTVSCTAPSAAWQATDVVVPCTAGDNAGGSGLVGPSAFSVQTNVPAGTETNAASIAAVTVQDVAGNTSAPQGPFGPFEVDKKPPTITGLIITPASPFLGQTVTASFTCADGGSGVVLCGPTGSPAIPATANTGVLNSPADGSAGPHTFTVYSQDAVNNQSVPSSVSYTVTQPMINFDPNSLSFGDVHVGNMSTMQVNVTNPGNGPLKIFKIAFLSGVKDNDEFSITNNCTKMVAPGGSCSFKVTFTAKRKGSCQRSVYISDDVLGSPQTIPLTVRAIP